MVATPVENSRPRSTEKETGRRGAYRGLATQPDKESEILVAISAEGGSKIASELSKGTWFQLYLALRVAGYHEFASSRRPVPFIADDVMETFYFTHHQHICEIARRICPSAKNTSTCIGFPLRRQSADQRLNGTPVGA